MTWCNGYNVILRGNSDRQRYILHTLRLFLKTFQRGSDSDSPRCRAKSTLFSWRSKSHLRSHSCRRLIERAVLKSSVSGTDTQKDQLKWKRQRKKKQQQNEAHTHTPLDERFWLCFAVLSFFLYVTFVWPLGEPFERSQGLVLRAQGGVKSGWSEVQSTSFLFAPESVITSITAAHCCNFSLWSLLRRAFIFYFFLKVLQMFSSTLFSRFNPLTSDSWKWNSGLSKEAKCCQVYV